MIFISPAVSFFSVSAVCICVCVSLFVPGLVLWCVTLSEGLTLYRYLHYKLWLSAWYRNSDQRGSWICSIMRRQFLSYSRNVAFYLLDYIIYNFFYMGAILKTSEGRWLKSKKEILFYSILFCRSVFAPQGGTNVSLSTGVNRLPATAGLALTSVHGAVKLYVKTRITEGNQSDLTYKIKAYYSKAGMRNMD